MFLGPHVSTLLSIRRWQQCRSPWPRAAMWGRRHSHVALAVLSCSPWPRAAMRCRSRNYMALAVLSCPINGRRLHTHAVQRSVGAHPNASAAHRLLLARARAMVSAAAVMQEAR
jgi:hypothetical protein